MEEIVQLVVILAGLGHLELLDIFLFLAHEPCCVCEASSASCYCIFPVAAFSRHCFYNSKKKSHLLVSKEPLFLVKNVSGVENSN